MRRRIWGGLLTTLFAGLLCLSTGGCSPRCILEGSWIDTPEGPRRVEHLRAGDEVWTRAPDGRLEVGRVVSIRSAWATEYVEVGETLRVTPSHPVWTPSGWREAGELTDRRRRGLVRVYDLEVEPNPNFYADGMLVHNKSTPERHASGTLKTIATAEADFRSNDRDQNGVNDFWVADVSGLYAIEGAGGGPIKLIEVTAALADVHPRPGAGGTKYAPLAGTRGPKVRYSYAALTYFEDDSGRTVLYDSGGGRHPTKFGFIAFPADYRDYPGRSFILDEGHTTYWKDLKGTVIDTFPRDPLAQGWQKLD